MKGRRYQLDTVSHLFVATPRKGWRNAFRFSATLTEPIDPSVLQQAVDDLAKRFPTFYVSLRCNAFTHFLEESTERLLVRPESDRLLIPMSRREVRTNCMRVLYRQNRLAAELYHGIADGRGGYVFFCNLVARYVELRHGVSVPAEAPIKTLSQPPTAEEVEDGMVRYARENAKKAHRKRDPHSYFHHGKRMPEGFVHLTTGVLDTSELLEAAHRNGVSVTVFLAAVMTQATAEIQNHDTHCRRRKPVCVTVPIDLRRHFKSDTLRNFALALNLGISPRSEAIGFDEICKSISCQLRAGCKPQDMVSTITSYVRAQESWAYRLLPLALKKLILNIAYEIEGERCACMSLSNLGVVALPEPMAQYVNRMEFVLGPLRTIPHNCGILSYGGKTYINIVRTICESELEERFFSRLKDLGVSPEVSCDGIPIQLLEPGFHSDV